MPSSLGGRSISVQAGSEWVSERVSKRVSEWDKNFHDSTTSIQ